MVPEEQTPDLQTSLVQALLSRSHEVPSAFIPYEQVPVAPLQVPGPVWHWSGALQVMAGPGVHIPALQTSVCVQPLLSLQLLLSAFGGLEQAPVAGLHAPGWWH